MNILIDQKNEVKTNELINEIARLNKIIKNLNIDLTKNDSLIDQL